MKFNRIIGLIFSGLLAALLSSCSYSFTGASVPSHLKTISIPLVKDKSSRIEPNLASDFSDELINKFLDDNTLELSSGRNSDAYLECTILSLRDNPTVISGALEKATSRKLEITVKVIYKDLVKKKTVFDKNFSNFTNYETTGDFLEARNGAITETIEKLTEDILLGVVANW